MSARHVALLAAAALACGTAPAERMVRIVDEAPRGTVPAGAVEISITFSGPVEAKAILDGRALALCRREDLREVTLLADGEAGLGPGAPVLAASAALQEGGTRAVLRPADLLPPGGAFAAVVSRRLRAADGRPVLDAEGKQRTHVLAFETGPARDTTPPRARWLIPPHGPAPRNLASLRVSFDEPVEGALALPEALGAGSRTEQPGPATLQLDLAAALPPGPLALSVRDVHDLAGNSPLPLEPLEVSRCDALAAPALGDARFEPGELSVRVAAPLAGMGRLRAEVSALPGDSPCGAAPEPPASALFTGEVLPCPGHDPCATAAARCEGQVVVAGLCPGRKVRVRFSAEDLAGHRGSPGPWLETSALAPRPALVLTEALADADAPEAGGEYAEIANVGTGDAELEGYALAKAGSTGTFTRCTLGPGAGGPLAPGGLALVVGGSYDGRYPLLPGVVLYRCGAKALVGGLANTRPVALALEDRAGQVVSTLGIVEPAPRCPTGALERVHPAGPDAASNLACPGTRTPGACNHATPAPECPRRPW